METGLHRELKERFGPEIGGRSEVVLSGFRIDAVAPDGSLVEVQSGALGPLRNKLARLLTDYRVRVVKPVVVGRRIVRLASNDGPERSARMSPKRGDRVDVFEDLVGLARLFPHPNLRVDVMEVEIDEVRVSRRRWPGYTTIDRRLRRVVRNTPLVTSADLWNLIPAAMPNRFTTIDLATAIDRSIDRAQRVAYCLRLSGAAIAVGKTGNRLVYEKPALPFSPL
jgi:hypothetical protein